MAEIPIILRGHDETDDAYKSATTGARRLASDVTRAQNQAGAATSKAAKRAGSDVEKVTGKTRNFAKAAATAFAGGVASAGLSSFTNASIAAGDEAEAAGLKLEAMLAKRGQSSSLGAIQGLGDEMSKISGIDNDKISETAAQLLGFGVSAEQIKSIMPGLIGQSRLYNQDLGQTAMAFGKAFASGNAGALKRVGVTLSDADVNAVKAAKNISEAAGQLELFRRVQESMKQYALEAGGGQSAAQLQRLYAGVKMGDVREGLGQGAGALRGQEAALITPLLERLAASPGALKAAGGGLEIATQLAPIMTAAATLGQSLPTFSLAGQALSRAGGAMRGLAAAGPATYGALVNAVTGLRASGFAAIFSGNANMLAATKTRMAGMTTAGALGTVGVALGALAVAAYGISKTIEGLEAVKHGTDADLEKTGAWGKIWSKGGRFVSNIGDVVKGRNRESAALDKQIAEQNKQNAAKFKKHGHATAKIVSAATAALPAATTDVGGGSVRDMQRAKLLRSMAKSKDKEGARLSLAIFDARTAEMEQNQAEAAQRKKAAQQKRDAAAAKRAHDKAVRADLTARKGTIALEIAQMNIDAKRKEAEVKAQARIAGGFAKMGGAGRAQIAALERERILSEARLIASAQTPEQAAQTMKLAQLKANAVGFDAALSARVDAATNKLKSAKNALGLGTAGGTAGGYGAGGTLNTLQAAATALHSQTVRLSRFATARGGGRAALSELLGGGGGGNGYDDVDLDPRYRTASKRTRTGTESRVTLRIAHPPGRMEKAAAAYR